MTPRSSVLKTLKKATKLSGKEIDMLLEIPPDPKLGDLAFPCFVLSKKFRKTPHKVALGLKERIRVPKGSIIKEVRVIGPYLNFFFDEDKLAERVLKQVWNEKEKYGFKKKNKKVVVVEYPAPNTNKPLTLGHLRNMSLGESVSRILESQGYNIKRVNLYNDRGVHISKSMLAYKKWGKGKKPDKKSDHFVGDFYVKYSKEEKKNPKLAEEIQEILRKWEAKDPETRALWKKLNTWVLTGFDETFKRFGLRFDKEYFENETYDKGRKIVLDGLKKGVFRRRDDGAVVIDLGKPLGEKVLLRADGTTVYVTQDLYLAQLKYKDYKYVKSIYVVGNEQDYHFKVLFQILNKLGFKFAKGCHHLSYGMVYLPSGRMKSREGTVIDADDLMDDLSGIAGKELRKRQKLGKKKLGELSEKIGLAALKYYLLKFSARKDFVFRPEESISFEGETGPYLQYSLVRANRIQEKVGTRPSLKVDFSLLNSPEEVSLTKKLSSFPEIISAAADSYSPHVLAGFAYDLASCFNSFYEKHSVINAQNTEVRKARLLLVNCYARVLSNCLDLLGIEEAEVM